MRRAASFLLLLLGAAVVFAFLAAWYLAGYQGGGGSMAGMMGQMMGGGYGGGLGYAMPSYFRLGLVLLAALMVAGAVGLAYYLALPEIRTPAPPSAGEEAASDARKGLESWAVLLRTSKPEEKRVLEILASHGGRYLQKFVVKEAGLSRLKTHRIVSRLAERGIVAVAKSGNTNELSLAQWLREDALQSQAH